jgi:hypothetical protein
MCGHKVQLLALKSHFRANETAAFSFTQVFVMTMFGCRNANARENRDAVLPALIWKIERERIVHFRELREFGNFVDALRPFDAAIDFLQANQVRVLLIDDFSDASEIEFLVHADTDMDVVGHYADRFRKSVWGQEEDGCENRDAQK